MIHRALLGSMERFAGILIEHYGGRFPAWLAPVQAAVLPVSDPHLDYAREVAGELEAAGLRVRVDERSRVGRAQDPRRRAGEAAVHGDRRRARAGGRAPRSVRSHDRGDLGAVALADLPAAIA